MNTLMYKSEYANMFRSEDALWWYKGLRDLLQHYVEEYQLQNPYILDAGCGTGKNIQFLTSLGFTHIEGFDYSPDAVSFCKQRGLEQVTQGNIMSVSYPHNTFDIIYCMDVLGSLDATGREIAVKELYRVLRPGGILIANTAALEIFRSQHDDVSNINRRLTRKEFNDLFKTEHSQIVKLSYRVFLLSPLILLFKLAKRITKLFKEEESQTDQVLFPPVINNILTQIQLLDNRLFKKFDLPFGSSVFIVAKKTH